jgi:hypothetical protein
MNILSDTFIVKFDDALQAILIVHPDGNEIPGPLVQIRSETLDAMNFTQASQFLGERLLLLIPQLRHRYAADIAEFAKQGNS